MEPERLPQQPTHPIPQNPSSAVTPIQTKKTTRPLIVVLFGIFLLGIGGLCEYYLTKPLPFSTQKTCSKEVKLCPWGFSVGRTGPKCEFAPCPTIPPITPDTSTIWNKYTNEQYKFSIYYPYKWKLTENSPERGAYEAIDIFKPESNTGIEFYLPSNPDSVALTVEPIKTEVINIGNTPTSFKYFYTVEGSRNLCGDSYDILRHPFNRISFCLDAMGPAYNAQTQDEDLKTIKEILANYKSL